MTRVSVPSRRNVLTGLSALAALLGAGFGTASHAASKSVKSGPQVGERPLPFTSNMVTGSHRGRQYCYVCELKDEPAVLVFARKQDEPTGELLQGLRQAVRTYRKDKFFAWMVFLTAQETSAQTAQERMVYGFAREHGATELPVSVLGDLQGPPGYLIAPEADLTCIVFRQGKVLLNRSYRAKEWNSRAVNSLLKEIPRTFDLKEPRG